MPFGGWFDRYYEEIFKVAIYSAGLEAKRADDINRPGNILRQIVEHTKKATVVLADLTDSNPNVYYELGIAHAMGKPTVLITTHIDEIPFDLKSVRIIHYEKNDPHWGDNLKAKITNYLNEVQREPETAKVKFDFL
jgi:nucleoside 2-deoxyribosyltransferase